MQAGVESLNAVRGSVNVKQLPSWGGKCKSSLTTYADGPEDDT